MASRGSVEPGEDLVSKGWEVCAPHAAAYFSAVGYYFARTIHRDLRIPVGIINSSIGGSPIRGWIARDAQDTIPELRESTEARLRLMRERDTDAESFPKKRAEWEARYIAGADRKFAWADARIDGDTVVVSSPEIPEPVAVRYAWVNNPEGCNLYNGAGLPAAPFRSDDWP